VRERTEECVSRFWWLRRGPTQKRLRRYAPEQPATQGLPNRG
jgi:hypothetical protein